MRPRVLHVIPSLGPGGAERQLVNVVTAATDSDHVVCHLGGSEHFVTTLRESGVPVHGLGLAGNRPWLAAARGVRRLVDEHQPTVVQSWLLDAAVPVHLALRGRRRRRWISTFHNTDYDPDVIAATGLPRSKVAVLRRIDIRMARHRDVTLVAVSETVRDSIVRHLGVDRASVHVVPNTFDPDRLRPSAHAREAVRSGLGIGAGDVVLLNVGRLDPQKGQRTLVDAVAAADLDVRVVVVGRGPVGVELEARSRELGIGERLHVVPPMEDIADVLAAADLFVFPSLHEGFGIALVEAMHVGLPVVATDLPVLREIVTDDVTGVLVPPSDVGALAGALTSLVGDAGRRDRLGRAGAASVDERFVTSQVIGRWERLWRSPHVVDG